LAEAGLASDKNKSLGGLERSVKALLEEKISFAVASVICVFLHVSTWRCSGSKFR